MQTIEERLENRNWLFDVLKGFFIGSGFIVPGVSGGAISAIFGVYEPLINWLANIKDNLWENIRYFAPIGLGGILGVGFFSLLIYLAMGSFETIMLWAFVGTILGMLPSLWDQVGMKGRDKLDILIMLVSFVISFIILAFGNKLIGGKVQASFPIWILCGFLISLGVLIPGLSSSNFILYMGLYEEMAAGFARFDLSIIIPIFIGIIATVLGLAKVFEWVFEHFYAKFYHLIFGVVISSTLMIIPKDYSGFDIWGYVFCFIALFLGLALGYWMSKLEEKYK